MSRYEEYEHHGKEVVVRSDLKGRHREHCLCHSCFWFRPDVRENNCPMARSVYALCVEFNLVLPVWECPKFLEKKES